MEANELRIGNKVMFSEDSTIFTVQEIDNVGIGVINEKEQTWIELEYFEPVQLTKEILLKCGFEKRTDGDYNLLKHSEVDIVIDKEFDCWKCDGICFSTNKIAFLHQLQNLYFALTGSELEITL